jgi:hypothetical protein
VFNTVAAFVYASGVFCRIIACDVPPYAVSQRHSPLRHGIVAGKNDSYAAGAFFWYQNNSREAAEYSNTT